MNDELILKLYLSWVNDFLTVERFAEYHNLSLQMANYVIDEGRVLSNK